ncbi:MAG: hypothetical protein V8K32_08260 [Candidatus Electrothrix gigas]
MHNKNIKRIVQKELKKNYPNWNRLNRKTKKEISRKVLAQVAGEYDFKQKISASSDALLGVEQQVQTKGIISLDQMADIVNESKNNNIIKLCGESRFAKYIKDEELRFIDQLLDNEIINRLLAYRTAPLSDCHCVKKQLLTILSSANFVIPSHLSNKLILRCIFCTIFCSPECLATIFCTEWTLPNWPMNVKSPWLH